MIRHHPASELVLDYAAGALAEPVALAVASHAWLCPVCRDEVARMEDLGGVLLQEIEPAAMSEAALQRTLAELSGPEPETPRAAAMPDDETAALIPPPLRRYLGGSLADLRWRWKGRGMRETPLALSLRGYRASLFRLRPGGMPPSHRHLGNEYTLVLDGSFSEDGEVYVPGDFAHADSSCTHVQRADPERGCLCLAVLDAPVRLTGGLARLVNPFLRF